MALLQPVPYNTKINFVGFRFITFAVALLVTLISMGGFFLKGLNYGIDFRGGYVLEVRMPEKPNLGELRDKLALLELGDVSLQEFGTSHDLLVRVERQEGTEAVQTQAIEKIKQTLGTKVDYRRIETVGPKVGGELIRNGVKAVGFALLAMLCYIAIRFEWQFGICAIIALLHDCVAITGLYSLFPFEFNETAIITVLITAGYSINDTIVIFDRIRENLKRYRRMPFPELINLSINETLSRTILTGTTTLLALTALYILGGTVISTFSLPIIIGVLFGSISSICLAAPLLLYFHLKPKEEGEALEAANR